MTKNIRRFAGNRYILAIVTVIIAAASGLLGDAVKGDDILGKAPNLEGIAWLLFISLGAALFLASQLRHITFSHRMSKLVKTRARALIMFLSPPRLGHTWSMTVDGSVTLTPEGEPPVTLSPGSPIDNDIEALNEAKPNWQQLLRALRPHIGEDSTLDRCILICTKAGSDSHADQAKALLSKHCPASCSFDTRVVADEFDQEATEGYLMEILEELKREIDEKHIVIDVTGGRKTMSIAGAMVTFSTAVRYQYVSDDNLQEVRIYDVRAISPSQ